MAETTEQELDPQEAEKLEQIERMRGARRLIEDLSSSSRRTRQFAARVLALLARREPEDPRRPCRRAHRCSLPPEAQTRWGGARCARGARPRSRQGDRRCVRGRRDGAVRRAIRHAPPFCLPSTLCLGSDGTRSLQEGVADHRRGHPVLPRRPRVSRYAWLPS